MIIYYNKNTGEIYGTIDGRVHTDAQRMGIIHPVNLDPSEVDKYEVKYKQVTIKVTRPITKMMVDPKTLIVDTYKVGEEEIYVPNGLEIDDKFAEFFIEIENGTKRIYNYQFEVENGEVVGIKPRPEVSK